MKYLEEILNHMRYVHSAKCKEKYKLFASKMKKKIF